MNCPYCKYKTVDNGTLLKKGVKKKDMVAPTVVILYCDKHEPKDPLVSYDGLNG